MTSYVGSAHDSYPYSAVVWVKSTFSDGTTYVGSGVLVGPNDVLTADHMVYSVRDGGTAVSVTVYPAYDYGDQPYGSYDVVSFDYTASDVSRDGLYYEWESQNDYALLSLGTNVGYSTGMMEIASESISSGSYNVTGYPSIYSMNGLFRMTNDYGDVIEDTVFKTWNMTGLEVNSGNSGGPLWYLDDSGTANVIGVVSTASWAADVTAYQDQIESWMTANDTLVSEWGMTDGDDSVLGYSLSDTVYGNQGDDTIFGMDGGDLLRGGKDSDVLNGNNGNDTVLGDNGDDTVRGGQGSDSVYGGKGNDAVYGDNQSDVVMGDIGDDILFGGKSADSLSGGDGNDSLSGDLGDDTLTGGDGADVFYARSDGGNDVVTDFDSGEGDRVAVSSGYSMSLNEGGLLVTAEGGGTLLLQGLDTLDDVYTTAWI